MSDDNWTVEDLIEESLKPCPFCGKQVRIQEIEGVYFVNCKECGAGSGGTINRHRVIESWNRRATDAQLAAVTAELAALRQRLAEYERPLPEMNGKRYEWMTDHRFNEQGTCIRCGEDAEEWDAGCVESIVNDLLDQAQEATQLRAELDALMQQVAGPSPDWATAPEWANYWAAGPNYCEAWWFEHQPLRMETIDKSGWVRDSRYGVAKGEWAYTDGHELPIGVDWRTTLQKRPAPNASA